MCPSSSAAVVAPAGGGVKTRKRRLRKYYHQHEKNNTARSLLVRFRRRSSRRRVQLSLFALMSSFVHLSLLKRKKSTKKSSLNFRVSKRLLFRVLKKHKGETLLGRPIFNFRETFLRPQKERDDWVSNVLPPRAATPKGRIVRVRRLGRPGVVVVFGWWWFSRGEKSPRAREPENASVFRPIRPTHRTAMDVLVSARRDVLSAGVPRPRVLHRDVRTGDL